MHKHKKIDHNGISYPVSEEKKHHTCVDHLVRENEKDYLARNQIVDLQKSLQVFEQNIILRRETETKN